LSEAFAGETPRGGAGALGLTVGGGFICAEHGDCDTTASCPFAGIELPGQTPVLHGLSTGVLLLSEQRWPGEQERPRRDCGSAGAWTRPLPASIATGT